MSRRRGRKPAAQPDARKPSSQATTGGKAEGRPAGRPHGFHGAEAPSTLKGTTQSRTPRVAVAVVVALAVIVAAIAIFRRTPEATERIVFAPPPALPADTVTSQDFVGAAPCANCHATQYDAWRASTHGRAGGAPTSDLLLRAFDGQPIRFADAIVTPRVIDGTHAFVVEQEGREPITLRVEGVVGGGHMVGGGTQGFFTRWSDGTLRFLPFELVRREGFWFCNTGTRLDGGWRPITADMRLTDCGDWPPVRVQGEVPRLGNCQQCHGSGIEVTPEPGRPAATHMRSWAVDCESCHGPARRHVALMFDSTAAQRTDIGLRPLATLDTDASLEVCFSCHALKDALRPGYSAGQPLEEYYSLALAMLGDEPVLPDGRTRTFAYQQGHLWSDCYLNGAMTCTDCHEPHGQGYRDVNGNAIAGRFDDRQCTSCHESKATTVAAHTKHAEGSAGSRCVSCHMPYLQQRDVGDALRYARSDHTIAIPRPAEDAALGIEVACAQCHTDVATDVLQAQVRRLWGEVKPRPAIVEGLLHATSEADATPLLPPGADTTQHRMALFMALGRLFDRLDIDEGIDDELTTTLRSLAGHADPDIAAAALAVLHFAAGEEPATRRFLTARIDSLGGSEHAVRSRWAVLLGARGDAERAAGDAAAAIVLYEKALEIRPDHAATLLNLGLARSQAGDATGAIADYSRSIALDSTRALAHVNLGIALAASGDVAGAEAAYRAAMRADAAEPLSYFNLGNLYLRAGRPAEAQQQYTRAVSADPSLSPAWFNLARARAAAGDLEGAIQAVDRGLEFSPDDVAGNGMRQELVQLLGSRSGSTR